MLSPLLIIGVGGAGGKTIRAMKQELNRILDSSGYTNGIPAAWQFLQIDTTYDGMEFPAPMLPQEEFHCVVPNGARFGEILGSIMEKGTLVEQQSMLAGWGIPESEIAINHGAGQIRAIGRQVGVADSVETLQAIQASILKMNAPSAMSELATIAHVMGTGNVMSAPQAFIISSLGGGSGSGMFMDTAELLKRATSESWAQAAISFLYTPEVFRSIGGGGRDLPKNSLGAMNELIASQWAGVSTRSELLYTKLGLASRNSSGEHEYRYRENILIGGSNYWTVNNSSDVSSWTMNDFFSSFAKIFSEAILNDGIQHFLAQQISYLSQQSTITKDDSGLSPEKFSNSTIFATPLWAIPSLIEPILHSIALSKNHRQTWNQFWDGRRTRPLTECIPFETEIRRSIITGWFVASLFGMRKVIPLPEGRTVQIWNPTLQPPGWSTFPSPLLNTHLEDDKRSSWILPQLLMSAGIALAEFGKSGNPEYINGYRLLKYLGREVTTSFEHRDHWDGNGSGDSLPTGERSRSQYLKNWVESGEKPEKHIALLQLLQESLSSSGVRSTALIETVELIRSEYIKTWDEMSSTAWHYLPETWELKEDIDLALSDIALYVSELHNVTPSNIA
jgi:hypothetical protein